MWHHGEHHSIRDVGKPNDTLKKQLMSRLGEVRTSTFVPCYNHTMPIEVQHEWQCDPGQRPEFLWIDRSRFCRNSTKQDCAPPDRETADASQVCHAVAMADEPGNRSRPWRRGASPTSRSGLFPNFVPRSWRWTRRWRPTTNKWWASPGWTSTSWRRSVSKRGFPCPPSTAGAAWWNFWGRVSHRRGRSTYASGPTMATSSRRSTRATCSGRWRRRPTIRTTVPTWLVWPSGRDAAKPKLLEPHLGVETRRPMQWSHHPRCFPSRSNFRQLRLPTRALEHHEHEWFRPRRTAATSPWWSRRRRSRSRTWRPVSQSWSPSIRSRTSMQRRGRWSFSRSQIEDTGKEAWVLGQGQRAHRDEEGYAREEQHHWGWAHPGHHRHLWGCRSVLHQRRYCGWRHCTWTPSTLMSMTPMRARASQRWGFTIRLTMTPSRTCHPRDSRGVQRRRWGVGLGKPCSAIMMVAYSAPVATLAGEVVVEPMKDLAHAVLGPAGPASDQADLLELFAGSAHLTQEFVRQGRTTRYRIWTWSLWPFTTTGNLPRHRPQSTSTTVGGIAVHKVVTVAEA